MVGVFLFKRPMKMEQSDPKRPRRGITQKKEYNYFHFCTVQQSLIYKL